MTYSGGWPEASDIQNRLKIDNTADLKIHQENWLDYLKRMGTYQLPRWLSKSSPREYAFKVNFSKVS
jgi:hypothetical protein